MRRAARAAPAAARFATASAIASLLGAALLGAGCAVRVPHTTTVTIISSGATLAGRIFLPPGPGPHPGLVLVQGASLASYDDLVDVARRFAARGIAAIAYDPRGTGGSTGDRRLARFEHLAHDALAAARILRAQPAVDSSRVGLYGFGAEGWIAALAASLDSTTSFLVLVSAPLASPLDQAADRRRDELIAKGMEADDAGALVRLRRRIWEYWLAPAGSGSPPADSLRKAFDAIRKRPWYAPAVEARDLPERLPADEGMGPENHPAKAWFERDPPILRSLRFDMLESLGRVAAPVLAIYGTEDRVVSARESERRLRRLATANGPVPRPVVRLFPDADHRLLVTKGSGLLRKVETAPGFEDTLSAWIARSAVAPLPAR